MNNKLKDIVLFGLNDYAELAYFYISKDTTYNVVAFCVDRAFMPEKTTHQNLPIICFEDVESLFPPEKALFFCPMSPSLMNKKRETIYEKAKKIGYEFFTYVNSSVTNYASKIGENCFILEDNTLQPFVEIGSNVILWSGNHIGHHSKISDHVTITSHVVVSGHCLIKNNCFLGVNSTVSNNITLSQGTLIALGTVVEKNTEEWSIYKGNPAEKMRIPSMKARI